MKRVLYTALLTSSLILPTSHAFSQTGSSGLSTGSSLSSQTGSTDSTTGSSSSLSGSVGVNNDSGLNASAGTRSSINTDPGMNDSPTDSTQTTSSSDLNSNTTGNAATSPDTRARSIFNNDADERASREQQTPNSGTDTNVAPGTGVSGSVFPVNNLDRQTVRTIQQTLNERGFNVGLADGIWGPSTAAQLQRFESSQGLTGSTSTTLNALTLQQLGIGVNEINPAAGSVGGNWQTQNSGQMTGTTRSMNE